MHQSCPLVLGGLLALSFLAVGAQAECISVDMDREGYHLNMTGMGALVHPGTNMSLYSKSVTAELFFKMEEPGAFDPTYSMANDYTLIGNMDRASKSGWRIGCFQSKCCFQAFVGHHWQQEPEFVHAADRAPEVPQEICSPATMMPGVWYQISASYLAGASRSDPGIATLMVDGEVVGSKEFQAQGDLAVEGSRISSEINVDYAFASGTRPWHQMAMNSFCHNGWDGMPAVTTGCAVMMAVGGDSFAGTPKYWRGALDEVRLWNRSLTQEEMTDTAYEIGYRDSCSTPYTRVASQESVTDLALYIHDRDRRFMGNFNEMPADSPALFVHGDAMGVLDARGNVTYIEKPITVSLAGNSQGIMGMPVRTSRTSVSATLDQDSIAVLDFIIRDPNYDDVVEVDDIMRYVPDYDEGSSYTCYKLRGLPVGLGDDACNPATPTAGWAVFQGKGAYFGPSSTYSSANLQLATGMSNSFPDAENDITSQPFRFPSNQNSGSSNLCRDMNVGGFTGVTKAPNPTRSQSILIYRLVWDIPGSLQHTDYWLPSEGLEVAVRVREYQRYTRGAADADLRGQLMVPFSPQMVNEGIISQLFQPESGGTGSTTNRVPSTLGSGDPDLADLGTNGQQIYLGAMQTTKVFKIRATDRNLGENLKIMVREDPGLPRGLRDGVVNMTSTISAVSHRETTLNGVLCSSQPVGYPLDYELTLSYRPEDHDLGAIYKTCFFACVDSGSECSTAVNSRSRNDVCVTFHVRKPDPVFSLPSTQGGTYDAILGCDLVIPFNVSDRSMQGLPTSDFAGYTMDVRPTVENSQVCDSVRCQTIPGGMPTGAQFSTVSSVPGESKIQFQWKPIRGQERHAVYKVCFETVAQGLGQEGIDATKIVNCIDIKVRKCMYCMQAGESLNSVARSFKMDFLQLYMSNPYIERPDSVVPGTVLTTGSTYAVRSGDDLHALSERFLVSTGSLEESNPDVQMGGGVLQPGMELCVRTPVCDVQCKYGTDCQLPQ